MAAEAGGWHVGWRETRLLRVSFGWHIEERHKKPISMSIEL